MRGTGGIGVQEHDIAQLALLPQTEQIGAEGVVGQLHAGGRLWDAQKEEIECAGTTDG